jgi:hypothetical protein
MQKSEVLYEPLPIGRIGVRLDDQEVITTNDFSCFAQMLEEYISFGVVHIVIPVSFPELNVIEQMPPLLRKRIKVIDDSKEIEVAERLLSGIRCEFEIKLNDSGQLKFPKDFPKDLAARINKVHSDVKRLALGFNHGIQIDIDTTYSVNVLRDLRAKVSDSTSRIILSQIEALLKTYKDVSFDALISSSNVSQELISIFDRLVNDRSYLQYSNSIARLTLPETRDQALVDLREFSRRTSSKEFVGSSWNYFTKILKVWTGIPLPESKEIALLIHDKALPPLVNLKESRQRAVQMWRDLGNTNQPLRRDGLPIGDRKILWIPPLPSMRVGDSGFSTLGTASELLKALTETQNQLESDE